MNFKIGDHVILISIGNADPKYRKWIGHSFTVASELRTWPFDPEQDLMHQIEPPIEPPAMTVSVPRNLMKIDPPNDIQDNGFEIDQVKADLASMIRRIKVADKIASESDD